MVRLSGDLRFGIPLPFFKYRDSPHKYFMSPKQIGFLRGLFAREGTKVWRDWPVSALLHEDFLDLQSKLEKVEATVDQALENALFFFAAGSSPRGEHLLVETADKAGGWLATQSLLQGTARLISRHGPPAQLHRNQDAAGPRESGRHQSRPGHPPRLRQNARRRQSEAEQPGAGRHGRRGHAAVDRIGGPQPPQEQLDRLRRAPAR